MKICVGGRSKSIWSLTHGGGGERQGALSIPLVGQQVFCMHISETISWWDPIIM